jgi:hypothetical protein
MSSTKNPEQEAENPAPMPQAQQGEAHKARMAPLASSPPGQEQDNHGNVIPLPQRTKDDQEKALSGKT